MLRIFSFFHPYFIFSSLPVSILIPRSPGSYNIFTFLQSLSFTLFSSLPILWQPCSHTGDLIENEANGMKRQNSHRLEIFSSRLQNPLLQIVQK